MLGSEKTHPGQGPDVRLYIQNGLLFGNIGVGYIGIQLDWVINRLCCFTEHVGFRSECEFVILSKLGMSELQSDT